MSIPLACTNFLAVDQTSNKEPIKFSSEETVYKNVIDSPLLQEKKYTIPLNDDSIIYNVTILETKTCGADGGLFTKCVLEMGEYYLKDSSSTQPIMRDFTAVKFTLDKDGFVYIDDPVSDISYSRTILDTKDYALGGCYEILYSPDQAILSTVWQLYHRQGVLNKMEYADDSNLDIICDSNGNIALNSKGINVKESESKILFNDTNTINKNTTNNIKITTRAYSYLDKNNSYNYKYICVRLDSVFINSKNSNLIGRAYVEATFRYNEDYNECECIQTLYSSDSLDGENNAASVYARSANMTKAFGSAYGTISLDIPLARDFQQKVKLNCDSKGFVTCEIS